MNPAPRIWSVVVVLAVAAAAFQCSESAPTAPLKMVKPQFEPYCGYPEQVPGAGCDTLTATERSKLQGILTIIGRDGAGHLGRAETS